MEAALSAGMTGAVGYAGTFVGNFMPVLLTIGGIALGMWLLEFARDYFRS
jgi:hypothetical protein